MSILKLSNRLSPRLRNFRIIHLKAFPIIETEASNIGYGGILKQDLENKISIVRYYSGIWSGPQINYSTVKKEILAIVLCIQKSQSDVFNKKNFF